MRTGRNGWRAGLALLIGAITWIHGVWVSHLLDLQEASSYCSEKLLTGSAEQVTGEWFPPGNVCHWADGTTTDLVPFYVNPVIFLCLVSAVLFGALAIHAARTRQ